MIELKSKLRKSFGTYAAEELRAEGLIPAIMYGGGGDNVNVSLSTDDVNGLLKIRRDKKRAAEASEIQLIVGRRKPQAVRVQEIQYNSLGDEVLHIDFVRV